MPRAAAAKRVKPARRAPRRAPASTALIPRVRGHGKYSLSNPGPVGRLGRVAGSLMGKSIGGPIGGWLGGHAGAVLGHGIGKIFGSGDYLTSSQMPKHNVLLGTSSSGPPSFATGENVVHIRHREFLGDVISSSSVNTFQIASYSINPGLSASFPWLSQVCGSTFQQYRINGMVFHYRTMSADALNNVNTALGQVIMATDYDSADAAFTSKAQMENTEFGVSGKPSCDIMHAIECARNQTSVSEQYVRAFAPPANADIRLYDLGKFYIATNGFQGTNVNCGELWVTYDITLFKAIQQPPGYLIPTAHYQLDPTNLAAQLLAPLAGNTGYDNIGLKFSSPATGQVSLPVSIPTNSVWIVSFSATGTATAGVFNTPPSISGNGGMVALSVLPFQLNTSSVQAQSPQGTAGNTTVQQIVSCFKYNGLGNLAGPPRFTVGNSGLLSAYSSGDLVITMVTGLFA